ncbi:MAG: hypothetical protein WD690_00790 [Vicinamibacterales bacterium]
MRRLAATFAVIVLAGCSASPTKPAPGAPAVPASSSFEGVWEFDYRVETCNGLRHCFAFLNATRTITLRAIRGTSGFDGVVTVFSDNVDVGGSIAGGTLSLRGIRRPAIANDYEVEVTKLDLRRERAEVTGTFEYTVKGPSNTSFFGSSRVGGPVTAARLLGPVGPVGFAGTWNGRVAVRDCSSVGWPDCYPHEPRDTYPFELSVAQHGSTVAGTLRVSGSTVINVEGTAAGNAVTLHGTATEPNYAFDEVTTLRPSTLARDGVGRLNGSITFEIAWPPKLPDLWTYKATDFRAVELVNVVLKPS